MWCGPPLVNAAVSDFRIISMQIDVIPVFGHLWPIELISNSRIVFDGIDMDFDVPPDTNTSSSPKRRETSIAFCIFVLFAYNLATPFPISLLTISICSISFYAPNNQQLNTHITCSVFVYILYFVVVVGVPVCTEIFPNKRHETQIAQITECNNKKIKTLLNLLVCEKCKWKIHFSVIRPFLFDSTFAASNGLCDINL